EDHPLVQDDVLWQSLRLDVGDERVELLALHQREDVRERMKLDGVVGNVIFGSDLAGELINIPALALGCRHRGEGRSFAAHYAAVPSISSTRRSQAVGTFFSRPILTVLIAPVCACVDVDGRLSPRIWPVSGHSGRTAFSLNSLRTSIVDPFWSQLDP